MSSSVMPGQFGIEKGDALKNCEAELRIAKKLDYPRIVPEISGGKLFDLIETAKAHIRT